MRFSPVLIGLAVSLSMPAGLRASEEVTKTLRAELPEAARGFAVENLAGRMRVAAGTGPGVTIVATVHAETQALADAVRLDKLAEADATTFKIVYPPNQSSIRYPEFADQGSWPVDLFLSSGQAYRYGGRSVRVFSNRGPVLYVDIEVQVPARGARGKFVNLVGRLDAEGIEGNFRFEVESADLRLERLGGDLDLHGQSGDMRAYDISGRWTSVFSSGDIRMDGFRGESLSLRTSSGDGQLRDIAADRVRIHTSSGDYRIEDADVGELDAESSSGNIDLDERSARLKRVSVRASSGDIGIRLPRDAAFDAAAEQGSGDMDVGFTDGTSRLRGDEMTGYRRGSGGASIRVRTTSGNLRIEPR